MGKVIHVSDELHAKLTKICKEEGVGLKELGERVLLKFIEGKQGLPPAPVPQKKKLETANDARRDGPSPWELPPFWQRGERDEGDSQEGEDQLEEGGPASAGGTRRTEGRAPPRFAGPSQADEVEEHAREGGEEAA